MLSSVAQSITAATIIADFNVCAPMFLLGIASALIIDSI